MSDEAKRLHHAAATCAVLVLELVVFVRHNDDRHGADIHRGGVRVFQTEPAVRGSESEPLLEWTNE